MRRGLRAGVDAPPGPTDASEATSKLFMRPCTDERFRSSSGRDVEGHDVKVILLGIVRFWIEKERTALSTRGITSLEHGLIVDDGTRASVLKRKNGRKAPLS